jgi:hypothetical protein
MAETDMTAASAAASGGDWLSAMDLIAEDDGYLERLGARHWAFFAEDRPQLLVTFERAETIRARESQLPAAYEMAKARGWSILTLIAEGETWWRDRAVWGYFDRLVDDAFFEDFDRVVFYGAGMGGYGAAAFSVAAPGCTVLALAPQATLDPELAEWDRRFLKARRLDFGHRFGFAPDMVEGCERAFLIYDPAQQVDAVHAAMFRGPQVVKLRARHIGRDPQAELAKLNVLRPLVDAACSGTLTAPLFFRLWRARRESASYLGRLIGRVQGMEKPARLLRALRAANRRANHPQLKAALAKAEAEAAR